MTCFGVGFRPGLTANRGGFFLSAWIVALVLAAVPEGAAARSYALLVGVSNYRSEAIPDLKGPVNDVRLMKAALQARGVDQIQVLADGFDGEPTRAAIGDAMTALAGKAESGDLVVLYLSGHGTRQADDGEDEIDGFDEVFLPSDASVDSGEKGSKRLINALIDDDLGKAVDAIRQKGADVWLIVDSCSSGTSLRSGASAVRARWVDPVGLGITSRRSGSGTGALIDAPTLSKPVAGRVIAFYAAQSGEEAQEVNFAESEGDSKTEPAWFGLMTAKLAARLSAGDAHTYGSLFQAMLTDMNLARLPGTLRRQTPLREGNLGDALVPGSTAAGQRDGVVYRISRGKLQAGLIQGIRSGDLLSLHENADLADAPIGTAKVSDVAALDARIEMVATGCRESSGEGECQSSGQLSKKARFARLSAPAVRSKVKVAPMPPGPNSGGAADWSELLAEAARATGTDIEVTPSDPDIAIARQGERLGFLRAGEPVPTRGAALVWNPSAIDDADRAHALAAVLGRIGRAIRVAQLGKAVAAVSRSRLGGGLGPKLAVIGEVETVDTELLDRDPDASAYDPVAECRRVIKHRRKARPIVDGDRFRQCELVTLRVRNPLDKAFDVNAIHIASDFSIRVYHKRIDGKLDEASKAGVLASWTVCSDCPAPSIGPETLLTVVSPAREGTDRLDLSALAQNVIPKVTRADLNPMLSAFLDMAAGRMPTRGALAPAHKSDVVVSTLHWHVVSRDGIVTD